MNLCLCGCGQPTKLGKNGIYNKYVNGHNTRVDCPSDHPEIVAKMRRTKLSKKDGTYVTPVSQPCLCGCGELAAPGSKYLPGHYSKIFPPLSKPGAVKKNSDSKRKNGVYERLRLRNLRPDHPMKNPETAKRVAEINRKNGVYERLRERDKTNNPWNYPEVAKRRRDRFITWINSEEGRQQLRENGKRAITTLLENSRYVWEDVGFLSPRERECAKLLLTKPIKGVNCNISVGSKRIDFYPQSDDKLFQGCFVEYHPCPNAFDKRTPEQYYKDRKQIIENSKYKGTRLILIVSLKEFIEKNVFKEEG